MSSQSSSAAPLDRLSGLLGRFPVSTTLLEASPVLRFARRYGPGGVAPESGHLHVVWDGAIDVVRFDGPRARRPERVEGPVVLLFPTGVAHQLVPVERAALTCAGVEFVHGAAHPLVRALPDELAIGVGDVAGLGATLGVLHDEVERVRCGHRLVASRLLEVVLLQLLRWGFDHPGAAGVQGGLVRGMSDPSIAPVLTAVHDAPGEHWTLERMADVGAMSRSAFAARFRTVVGETPAAYLATYRVALAQDGLLRGEPVGVLARDLGYATGSGLTRAFTAQVGQPPSEWLASHSDG